MEYTTRFSIVALSVILLIGIPVIAGAATVPPDSAITYTITLSEDGTANWHVEYRTLLASDEDLRRLIPIQKMYPLSISPSSRI